MNTRLKKIEQPCRKCQVKALYIFGSRSAEIFQAIQNDTIEIQPSQSDLDIGVLRRAGDLAQLERERMVMILQER